MTNPTNAPADAPQPRKVDSVTRFVVTYVNKDGMRTLAHHQQGRWTHATPADAHADLNAMLDNNSPERVASIWGKNPRFEVRPCECWPVHFDPKGIWFND